MDKELLASPDLGPTARGAGTTSNVLYFNGETVYIACSGDSRAIMGKRAGGKVSAFDLSKDHKPDLPAEKARIEALGGFVSFIGCWRAMGILAMSRAIGDLFLKPYVSAEPEIKSMAMSKEDEFLVIASDGVFDVFDNDQVVQIVRSAPSPEQGAHLLTSSAFAAGSLDNITAVVVALRAYRAGATETFVPSPREEGRRRPGPVGMALRGCAPEEPDWVNSLDWLHRTALCA